MMPHSNCPNCGKLFHIAVNNLESWYAQHFPEKKVGDVVNYKCFECWKESLDVAQRDFFGRAQRLRAAIEGDLPEALLHDFSAGTTLARATLHLARACVALGQSEKALQLVRLGLELASDRAISLRAQLNAILEKVEGGPLAEGGSPVNSVR